MTSKRTAKAEYPSTSDDQYPEHERKAIIFKNSLHVLGHYLLNVIGNNWNGTSRKGWVGKEELEMAVRAYNRIDVGGELERHLERLERVGFIKQIKGQYALTRRGKAYMTLSALLRDNYLGRVIFGKCRFKTGDAP